MKGLCPPVRPIAGPAAHMEWTMKRCGAAATAGVVLSFVLLAVFLNTWFLLSGGASLPTSAGATVQQAGKSESASLCYGEIKPEAISWHHEIRHW